MINSRVTLESSVISPTSQIKISKDFVSGMYRFVGLDYDKMVEALTKMAELDLLYKGWTKQNIFKGQSYIICECIYYYLAPTTAYDKFKKPIGFQTQLHRIPLVEKPTDYLDRSQWHYWLSWPNNLIVDLALQEFDTVDKIPDFKISKSMKILQPQPTMRAIKLAELLKIRDEDD